MFSRYLILISFCGGILKQALVLCKIPYLIGSHHLYKLNPEYFEISWIRKDFLHTVWSSQIMFTFHWLQLKRELILITKKCF